MDSPLHQFQVQTLISLNIGGFDVSFTNSALYMMFSMILGLGFLYLSTHRMSLVPGRIQSIGELGYEFVANLLQENVGTQGRVYIPFIFSIFLFILLGNMLGMLPYSFTFTSQIILTFGMAMIVFLIILAIGVYKHKLKFFKMFLPEGSPLYLAPILIPIELISYLSRPISLSIRLFANMMAGHTMLKVFALFTVSLGVFGISTVILNSLLIAFECLVAFLQAYVFTILACLYLNDSIHLHS